MPNSANRSKGGNNNAGKGQPEHRTSRNNSEKANPERSDLKRGSDDNSKDRSGDTSRTSNQGRKSASGGS